MRSAVRRLLALGLPITLALIGIAVAGVAFAGTITTPSAQPFVVPANGAGQPLSFTVVGSGYPEAAGSVFIEQCDGVAPSTAGYTPLDHCDAATSPAAVDVGADGLATFPADDLNFGFTPFKGKSPQNKFNCVAPGETLNNGKPSFENCQIRVSTNNLAVTADQAYRTITLPATTQASTTTTTAAPTTTTTVGPVTTTTTVAPATTTTTTVPQGTTTTTAVGATTTTVPPTTTTTVQPTTTTTTVAPTTTTTVNPTTTVEPTTTTTVKPTTTTTAPSGTTSTTVAGSGSTTTTTLGELGSTSTTAAVGSNTTVGSTGTGSGSTVNVSAGSGALPFTGAPTRAITVLALALIGAGLGLAAGPKRRARRSDG
jgi:hypothetical protein